MQYANEGEWLFALALAVRLNAMVLGYSTERGVYLALLPRALWQRGHLA